MFINGSKRLLLHYHMCGLNNLLYFAKIITCLKCFRKYLKLNHELDTGINCEKKSKVQYGTTVLVYQDKMCIIYLT